jgi:hypothetical protein
MTAVEYKLSLDIGLIFTPSPVNLEQLVVFDDLIIGVLLYFNCPNVWKLEDGTKI